MSNIYIDQSANELRLNLVYSKLDKSDLNVLISKSITFNDIDIEVGIIGASHFLTVKYNDKEFSEVFACLELNNTTQKCIVKKANELLLSTKEVINNDLQYEFSLKILNWYEFSEKKYKQFTEDTVLYSKGENSLGLSHVFPYKKDDKYVAKTEVFCIQKEKRIIVETLHSYPNEEKLVFTKTVIENSRSIYE